MWETERNVFEFLCDTIFKTEDSGHWAFSLKCSLFKELNNIHYSFFGEKIFDGSKMLWQSSLCEGRQIPCERGKDIHMKRTI